MTDAATDAAAPAPATPSPICRAEQGASTHRDGLTTVTAWHYGAPLTEQRRLERGPGLVDGADRALLLIGGPDRATWLNAMLSQKLDAITPGTSTEALLLNAQGRVEQHLRVHATEDTLALDVAATRAPALLTYLQRMVFQSQVTIEQADAHLISILDAGHGAAAGLAAHLRDRLPGVADRLILRGTRHLGPVRVDDLWVPRAEVLDVWKQLRSLAEPLGDMAVDALRILARIPDIDRDLDATTIPHEVPTFIDPAQSGPTQPVTPSDPPTATAVHINKGCYRGQETVSRVHNLGKPPRQLVLLHLDGTTNTLPPVGAPIRAGSAIVGRMGSSSHDADYGPLGLALLKRSVLVALPGGTVPPLTVDLDLADAAPASSDAAAAASASAGASVARGDVAVDPEDVAFALAQQERVAPGRESVQRLRSLRPHSGL